MARGPHRSEVIQTDGFPVLSSHILNRLGPVDLKGTKNQTMKHKR